MKDTVLVTLKSGQGASEELSTAETISVQYDGFLGFVSQLDACLCN